MLKTKSFTVLNSCLSPLTWMGVCLRYSNLKGLNLLWCILIQYFWQNLYKKIVPETKAEPETLSYNHFFEVRNYLLLPSVKSNKDSKDIVTTQHFICVFPPLPSPPRKVEKRNKQSCENYPRQISWVLSRYS